MGKVTCIYLLVTVILCFVQGDFRIKTEFMNGNLKFTWNGDEADYYIKTQLGTNPSSGWIVAENNQYTVKEILKYANVTITVDGYQPYPTKTYHVSRVDVHEGESTNITWTAEFFPRSGQYNIYHFDDDTIEPIMRVMMGGSTTSKPLKYVYHTRPYNSTNIMLEVKKVTLMDAGYYAGGTIQTNARSGPGVILIVRGKPSKPGIKGNLKMREYNDVTLDCFSNSTSRPSYYSKMVSLAYIWYRNNSIMSSETKKTLRILRISKEDRFNKYSCRSKETIESEKSDEIQINVLYGPSDVTIRPQLPVSQKVTVKDGDYIGPYHCSADCNPPCSIQWKYKLSNGTFKDAESDGGTLLQQRVFRNKTLFRCVAKPTSGNKARQDIKLHIIYLSMPIMTINGNREGNVNISEGKDLNISCSVEGKPIPRLNISRYSQENFLKTNQSNVISYRKQSHCDDTDIYKCTASSAQSNIIDKEVTLNVLCTIRIDSEGSFKPNYGSRSGQGVKVVVNAPIISYPKPSKSLIIWLGPTSTGVENEIRQRGDVIYKHWITSTIPIKDQRYFGNYTMAYQGKTVFVITIKELITPEQSKTLHTSTIVLAIICTVVLVTISIIAGVAFRRRLKRRLESKPSQSENEANTPMNATEVQQQQERAYDYPLNEYEKINVATDCHTYTTTEQPQPEDIYEYPFNEYEKINVATDGHTYDKVA